MTRKRNENRQGWIVKHFENIQDTVEQKNYQVKEERRYTGNSTPISQSEQQSYTVLEDKFLVMEHRNVEIQQIFALKTAKSHLRVQ